jgi:hypothetical protein
MHRSLGASVRDVWSKLLRLGYSAGRRRLRPSELDARAAALALRDMTEGDRPCEVVRLPLVLVPAFG